METCGQKKIEELAIPVEKKSHFLNLESVLRYIIGAMLSLLNTCNHVWALKFAIAKIDLNKGDD